MVKKVVTTVSRFGNYTAEIRQSYELGFTPYRLHTNVDGTFVTPIRTYDGHVCVLDDVTTRKVTTRQIATDNISSKLTYFIKGDDDGGMGFALHGDRGPSGANGLKGDSGDRGPTGSRGPTGKRGAAVPEGPPGKIGNSYSTLWVNGAYVSNFDSTASFGSDQRLTLGNIIDGGDVPFL